MKPKLIALSYDVYMTQREAAQYPLPPAPGVNAGQLERSRGVGSVSVSKCVMYVMVLPL